MTPADDTPAPRDMSDPMQRPRYTGLPTFFRLPYREEFSSDPPDIGVVGVPFDGGVTNRTGTRHGPREVRNQSSLIRRINQATGASPFEAAKVADIGDAWIRRPFDLASAHREIEADYARIHGAGIRPLSCGGDHSMSLPILRALAKDGPPLALLQIDAHCDTGDDYLGSRFHHGAPFKIAVDEGLIDPKKTVQIGIRGSLFMREMWQFSYDSGMRVMMIEEVEEKGWRACMAEALEIIGETPTYVSFDIDSLDPSIAPGTGTPEVGGLTTREAQGMIRMMTPLDIRGADMVEVSPPFDIGGLTAMAGANVMFELLCAMAKA
ncbi:MAG: agmatinase [Pseudomonadota bacterium]